MDEQKLRKLCHRTQQGDQSAFDEVVVRASRMLMRSASRRLGDLQLAENAVQETFIALHKRLLSGDVPDELLPWLFVTLRNKALMQIRQRSRHNREQSLSCSTREGEQSRDVAASDPSPDENAGLKERKRWGLRIAEGFSETLVVKRKDGVGETVRKEVLDAHMARDSAHEKVVCSAICQLSSRQHQCIVLQNWLSLRVEEIALTLGDITVNSVRTHLCHARKRLCDLLQGTDLSDETSAA